MSRGASATSAHSRAPNPALISLRIGIVAPPAIGQRHPLVALALELTQRGHGVLLFTVADGARRLAVLPLELVTIGAERYPLGSVDALYVQPTSVDAVDIQFGRLSGLADGGGDAGRWALSPGRPATAGRDRRR